MQRRSSLFLDLFLERRPELRPELLLTRPPGFVGEEGPADDLLDLKRESCSVAESVTDSSLEVTETALEASVTEGSFRDKNADDVFDDVAALLEGVDRILVGDEID